MLDGQIRRWMDAPLDRIGRGLARAGLHANLVTIAGFLLGVGAWVALAWQAYTAALALIAVNRLADGLDGALARRLGPTDLGGYLDIVLDFLFYSGVPFFFAVGRPEFALPAAFLVFSFLGTGTTFLAFAVMAAKKRLTTDRQGKKSIYYLGGLTEGFETIVVFVLICLVPEAFAWFAWIFGGLCWLTTLTRIAMAVEALREPHESQSKANAPQESEGMNLFSSSSQNPQV
jgi:phosphatidylglycerophosphate synthase